MTAIQRIRRRRRAATAEPHSKLFSVSPREVRSLLDRGWSRGADVIVGSARARRAA